MDVFTLLRSDHERVFSFFTRLQSGFPALDTPERHRLFQQLKKELEVHAAVEDLHVYRVFQQAEATRDEAHDALEAHAQIKTLLDELDTASTYDHTWVSKVQELRSLVEQHVTVEEKEMFPKAVGILTTQEAEELGVTVETAKHAISRNAPTTDGGTPEELQIS